MQSRPSFRDYELSAIKELLRSSRLSNGLCFLVCLLIILEMIFVLTWMPSYPIHGVFFSFCSFFTLYGSLYPLKILVLFISQ